MKKKGLFIVIEGGDGAGKATQLELLQKALVKSGQKISCFDFPQYESFFGKIVGQALKGEHGDFLALSPFLASMPFMLDRFSAREAMRAALKKGNVLSNRYTPSNVVYQAAKLSGKARQEFISFLEKEYELLDLPRPSLVIYLKVPVEVSAKLITEKAARTYMGGEKGVKDLYETNVKFQTEVQKLYRSLARKRPEWRIIECFKKGRLLSREEVHELVMDAVAEIC